MSDQTTSRPDTSTGSRTSGRVHSDAVSDARDGQTASNDRQTTASKPQSMRAYAVTYVFTERLRGKPGDASSLITATVAAMQRDGVSIDFLGATQELDSDGGLTEVTARYASPTKGTIGRLNCRGSLPASGQPQSEESETSESTGREVAAAGR